MRPPHACLAPTHLRGVGFGGTPETKTLRTVVRPAYLRELLRCPAGRDKAACPGAFEVVAVSGLDRDFDIAVLASVTTSVESL